ncbi:hypothetical protein [Agromyces bauzanensis]
MTQPFIFVASYPVKPNMLEKIQDRCRSVAALVQSNEPQLLAFHFYLDEARGRLGVIQVHPDAASVERHLTVIAEHLAAASDWFDLEGGEEHWFGTPPDDLTRYAVEHGETVDAFAVHVAGFTRSLTASPVG